jgi:hypothetical protein
LKPDKGVSQAAINFNIRRKIEMFCADDKQEFLQYTEFHDAERAAKFSRKIAACV